MNKKTLCSCINILCLHGSIFQSANPEFSSEKRETLYIISCKFYRDVKKEARFRASFSITMIYLYCIYAIFLLHKYCIYTVFQLLSACDHCNCIFYILGYRSGKLKGLFRYRMFKGQTVCMKSLTLDNV